MHAVDIRIVRPEDISDLLEIEQLSFPTCWLENFLNRAFGHIVTRLWLARNSADIKRAVGYLAAIRSLDELHLLQIATHPKYRRLGIATALVKHALNVERNLKTVQLEVRETNEPAIFFYKRMGFDHTGRHPRYYSDTGEDALLLTRELQ